MMLTEDSFTLILAEEVFAGPLEPIAQIIKIETHKILAQNLRVIEGTVNLRVVAKALEKQNPKKVLNGKLYYGIKTGACPVCKERQSHMNDFCFKCGQKLDWKEAKGE